MDVELSDGIRGAVKGYADAKNIPLSTAYRELLEQGISHAAYRPSRQSPEQLTNGSLEEVYYSPIADRDGLQAHTFERSFPTEDCLTFGGSASLSSTDEFTTAVANMWPYLSRPDRAWFSISNYDGHWYGRGFDDFYTALTNPGRRYEEDYTGKRHNNETALFFGSLNNYGYIVIMAQPRLSKHDEWEPETDSMWKLAVHFVVKGYPLDTSVYEFIAQQFGVDFASASESACRSATLEGAMRVDPTELVLEHDDSPDDEPFVRAAIIPNPLHESPQSRSELTFSTRDRNALSQRTLQTLRERAAKVEYVPLQFQGPDPTERMFSEIQLNSITISTDLVFSGFEYVNMEVVGADIE